MTRPSETRQVRECIFNCNSIKEYKAFVYVSYGYGYSHRVKVYSIV